MALRYRPEVDGLRAIAVIAVVLYHVQLTVLGHRLLPGGFLGVDVFFVISGYLISRIILSELAATSGFDYLHFYERRARRILPMLFTTLLVAFPLGWFSLLPSAFVEMSWSALSAVFFGSNFFFYFATTEYGAEANLLHPLLHTWSLGVEEQFYLLFPVLVVFAHRLRVLKLWVLAALALASLAFAQAMTRIDYDLNFYLLPSRMWELLAGTLLAFLELNSDGARPTHARSLGRQTLPLLGLLAVILPMVAYTDDMAHPGLVTVVPVAGTALLIHSLRTGSLVRRMMRATPIVWTGLISYSLYLWHFPILACLRNLYADPSPGQLAGGIVATVLLSILSYRFIEQPFRNRRVVGRRPLVAVLAGGVAVLCALPAFVIREGGGFARSARLVRHLENYSYDNRALLLESRAFSKEHATDFPDNGRVNVLVVGNSHARDLFNALFLHKDRFPGLNFSRSRLELSCFAFESSARDAFLARSRYRQADVILVSTRYSYDTKCKRTDPRGWSDVEGLKNLILAAERDGKTVVVSGNTVEFRGVKGRHLADFHVARTRPTSVGDARELIATINRIYYQRRYTARSSVSSLNAELEALADTNRLVYLDKGDYLCAEDRQVCFALTPDGRKSFADEAHLTLAGARFFGQRLVDVGWLLPLYEKLEVRGGPDRSAAPGPSDSAR